MSNHNNTVEEFSSMKPWALWTLLISALCSLGFTAFVAVQAYQLLREHVFEEPFSPSEGTVVFASDDNDCANRMTDETMRLYGPLAEQVANNGLVVTVHQGGSVWRELELAVLSAQIGAEDASIRNFDHWATDKARTRPERERITGNLLVALRRQEGSNLNDVQPNSTFTLKPTWTSTNS